jgi:hypothetical protein
MNRDNGDLERSTFANHEQETLSYYTQCLRPWLENIEQELASKLIAKLERTQQLFEHVTEGFLRADVEKRGQFYTAMLNAGVFSINEVRNLENLPPVDGGERPRVPMNYEPLPVSATQMAVSTASREVDPAMMLAVRSVVLNAWTRCVQREVDNARKRVMNKGPLFEKIDFFYARHLEQCREALRPVVSLWLTSIGATDDPELVLDAHIRHALAESSAQFHQAVEDTPEEEARVVAINLLVSRWEQGQAAALTDRLLRNTPAAVLGMAPTSPPSRRTRGISLALAEKIQRTMEVKHGLRGSIDSPLYTDLPPALARRQRQLDALKR